MRRPRSMTVALILVGVGLLAAGCAEQGPPLANINSYLRSTGSVMRLHRVVFISLDDLRGPPQIAEGMSEALVGAIQARRLFHIDRIDPTDRECELLPLSIREPYSMKQLAQIRKALNCDAVIFGAVSHFQTHPRMQIGVYVRLMDLRNGNLIWSVDQIWDSTEKQTEQRIEYFFDREMRSGYDPVQWRLTFMSPKVFQKFIAYEAANTLPDRSRPRGQQASGSTVAGRIGKKLKQLATRLRKG